MSTLLTIMAHAGGQEAFDRHQETWEALGHPILVFCPGDSLVASIHPQLRFGHACHNGPHSIERFFHLLFDLEKRPYEKYIVLEYDALCLEQPEIGPVLRGNVFPETSTKWLGKQFTHPPLTFDRSILEELVRCTGMVPYHAERGFWDRVLGYMADLQDIPLESFGAKGFSQNTIEPHQIADAVQAKKNGARHFHGVKTAQCFEAIMKA